MDPGLIFGVAFLGAITAVVTITILRSIRQQRRRSVQPARHQGERQSQRGRVYKNSPTHVDNPDSW